jgi:hypothetical protein
MVGAFLLLQSLLVPMLETAEGARRVVLESEHSAASCVVGHDHSICIQAGANRTLTTSVVRPLLQVLAISFAAPTKVVPLHSAALDRGHSTRAPPSIA